MFHLGLFKGTFLGLILNCNILGHRNGKGGIISHARRDSINDTLFDYTLFGACSTADQKTSLWKALTTALVTTVGIADITFVSRLALWQSLHRRRVAEQRPLPSPGYSKVFMYSTFHPARWGELRWPSPLEEAFLRHGLICNGIRRVRALHPRDRCRHFKCLQRSRGWRLVIHDRIARSSCNSIMND